MPERRVSLPGIIAVVIVAGTVIAAVIVTGGPGLERQRRFDDRRVQDLSLIVQAVNEYWRRHKALPRSLDDVVSDHQLTGVPHDPETNMPYDFSVTGPAAYHVCATFRQAVEDDGTMRRVYGQQGWMVHGKGRECYDLTPPEGR